MNKECFLNISLTGRLAYLNMCIEKYLITKYPDRDFKILAEKLWMGTKEYWNTFSDYYSEVIPWILMGESYEDSGLEYLSKEDYNYLLKQYNGITRGEENNKKDIVNYLLQQPDDFVCLYEGTDLVGCGEDSIKIVLNVCKILEKEGIQLPDINKVAFSSFNQNDGYGDSFDGRYLSVILN